MPASAEVSGSHPGGPRGATATAAARHDPPSDTRRLPRGRHNLTRAQVEDDQRIRIALAVAETMSRTGYANTPVADIIKEAGVSRETFYRLFDDKLDAFLGAFDLVSELLVGALGAAIETYGSPMERVERAVSTYVDAIAAEPRWARLFLVEVNAAGTEAIERRQAVQDGIVDVLADVLGARSPGARHACRVVVSSVSAMLVVPLVHDDPEGIRALGAPTLEHLRHLERAGMFDG